MKIEILGFECLKSIRNYEKKNAWNIRCLVDESFVQASHQVIVICFRLSDLQIATKCIKSKIDYSMYSWLFFTNPLPWLYRKVMIPWCTAPPPSPLTERHFYYILLNVTCKCVLLFQIDFLTGNPRKHFFFPFLGVKLAVIFQQTFRSFYDLLSFMEVSMLS